MAPTRAIQRAGVRVLDRLRVRYPRHDLAHPRRGEMKLLFILPLLVPGATSFGTLPLHAHFVDSGPRSRAYSLLSPNGSSIPADGAVWPTGIYWTTVQVGTPPVNFPVCIDSGSGDLDISAVQCDGCPTAPPNNGYDHTTSSTSKPTVFPKTFSNSYQTCDLKNPTAVCTISGKTYFDQVSLAGFGPVTVKLGAIDKQTPNFDQFKRIGGVMGFTGGGNEDVFAQLVAAQKVPANIWAICMFEGANSNGTITIGGVDERLSINGSVSYVADVGIGFHSVRVESLTLGGGSTIAVDEAAILDTGTNILLAPTKVVTALRSSMCADTSLSQCSELWSSQCVEMTMAEVDAYPSLSMQLDGALLEMSARDYILQGSPVAEKPGQFCLGIRDGGSAGGSGFIIGDTTMRNYYLVFDLGGKKIGWGKVNRDNCGSI